MPFIPVQEKAVFLVEVSKALGATKNVLEFYGIKPAWSEEIDIDIYAQAMLKLCRELKRDSSGVAHLEIVGEIFALVAPPFKGATPEQLRNGTESAIRYKQWLYATFRDAKSKVDRIKEPP